MDAEARLSLKMTEFSQGEARIRVEGKSETSFFESLARARCAHVADSLARLRCAASSDRFQKRLKGFEFLDQ